MALLTSIALSGGLTLSAGAQRQQTPGRLVTTTYVDNVGGLFEFNADDSNPVSLTPYSLQGARGQDGTPSVSGNGAKIAFSSYRNTIGLGDPHIWLMNGDGTNAHALTTGGVLSSGDAIKDRFPVISPDGTKIAFISNRYVYAFPNSFPYNGIKVAFNDVYVINADGTGLHQVTPTQVNTSGGGASGSVVDSVAWGPDSNRLVYRGYRLVTVNNQTGYHNGVFFINADGSGDTTYTVIDDTGQSPAIDWSPNGRYITTAAGGGVQGSGPYRLYIFDLLGGNSHTLLSGAQNVETGGPGTIRFSPDSSKIVYLTTDNYTLDHPTISNLDGSGMTTLATGLGRFTWLWWQGGAAVPTPAKLTLSYNIPPDLLLLFTGQPGVQVVPTLYDVQGNVIVHAVGTWDPSDSRFFTLDALGIATPIRSQDLGPLSLTASNGGVTSNKAKVMINLPNLQVKLDQVFNYAGNTQARFYFANPGSGGASNVTVTSVTLDGISPNPSGGFSTLPYYVGNVSAGQASTADAIFVFPISGKPSGTPVLLKVKGTYDYYGSFSATLRVTIP